MPDTIPFPVNRALELSDSAQDELALKITTWYKNDRDSRAQWDSKLDEYYKLSICEPVDRVPAFEGGANVCTPIVASAVLSFTSRARQSIINTPDGRIVGVMPITANDKENAIFTEQYLNWQLTEDMPEFQAEFDKTLFETSTFGTGWQKTTWDRNNQRPLVMHVPTVDVFIPYNTRDIEKAPRIIQRLRMLIDDIRENPDYVRTSDLRPADQVSADFEDKGEVTLTAEEATGDMPSFMQDESTDRNTVLEAHVWMKIEEFGDTIRQPYIITVDVANQKVLSITSRKVTHEGEEVVINHWVDYHFITNSQGFYSYGYGQLLNQLNHVQNTIYNLAIDSGRLSNTPFIIYGRGAGLKGRNLMLRPGVGQQVSDVDQVREFKMSGLDNSIIALMQQTEKFGQDITSNAEELQGRAQKGVREPTATGTQLRIEQGLVQFNVLTQRIMASFKRQLKLIQSMNAMFLTNEKTFRVLGTTDASIYDFSTVTKGNLSGKFDVIPTGDASFSSPGNRRQEALNLMQVLMQNPMVIGMEGILPPNLHLLRRALEDFLRTFEKNDLADALPVIPPRSIPPAQENQLLIEGDSVEPKPGEVHVAHLSNHEAFRQTEDYNRLPADAKQRIDNHIEQTRIMLNEEIDAEARFALTQQIMGQQAQLDALTQQAQQPQPVSGPGGQIVG